MADTATRVLPGPSDDAAWTAETVADIARVTVDERAHALAHPVPQHGCPYGECAGGQVAYRNPAAELTWIEDARWSPVRHEVTA
ncbi:hypothetical protein MED01_002312 [Micromonospora sp. MED01]|uniref:hypothetical protein n=1 Tax=Micromonospora alfalfae TaxID=2911212 RepID=UPI001EE80449|nr:hypothetical protein [Micromonospora alfalfae]MCG5464147.1 hypothetical protein [Micromonospora alfalfae]